LHDDVEEGIRADSLSEAEDTVANLRSRAEAAEKSSGSAQDDNKKKNNN
jgi:hypothetical protein